MTRFSVQWPALFFISLLIASPSSSFAHGPSPSQAVSQQARARGEQLTMDLVRLNTEYQLAGDGQKAGIERKLLAAALTREQELLGFIESDPGEVLRLALPSNVRASLPASVQAHIEQETEIEGALEVVHADNDTGGGRYLYHLRTTSGRLSLHFAADPPDLSTDTVVRAKGLRLQDTMALGDGSSSIVPVTSVPTNTFGEQRVLVIPVSFTDKAAAVYNWPDIMQKVDAYYRSNTFQRTWVTSTITPIYLIDTTSTVCDYWKVASLARAAAQAGGYDLTKYNRHVFAHPKTACTWSGWGTIGGNPSGAWLNGIFPQSTVGHELGHNFGAYHSHSLACIGSTCTKAEYGDSYDIMGTSSSLGHFNAFQKERLGWLNYPPQETPPVLTVYGSGQYAIDVYEPWGTIPKALKILKSTDPTTGKKTWYYVESRSTGNILLHSASESSADSSYLWDLIQDTSTTDWVLNVGQAYYDPAAGVTITALSAGSTGATLQIDLGTLPCVRSDPTQALSPADAQWLPRTATASYTVTVTNKDSTSCPPSTFGLQAAVPTGWLPVFDKTSVTVTPGASVAATLTAYPPSTAASGFYSFPVTSANQAEPAYDATTVATAVLVDALTVTVSFDKSPPVYSRNQTIAVSTTATAPDATGVAMAAAGASVSLTIQKPGTKAGATLTVSGTTDSSGKFLYTLKIRPNDPAGTWTVQSTVTKSSVTGTTSTSLTVQ